MAVFGASERTIPKESIMALMDRAAAEPEMLHMLAADPIGASYAAGVRISGADLKQVLGVPFATDLELVELLRARLQNYAQGASCGCGG